MAQNMKKNINSSQICNVFPIIIHSFIYHIHIANVIKLYGVFI